MLGTVGIVAAAFLGVAVAAAVALVFFRFTAVLAPRDGPSPEAVPANPILSDWRRPAMGDWEMLLAGA